MEDEDAVLLARGFDTCKRAEELLSTMKRDLRDPVPMQMRSVNAMNDKYASPESYHLPDLVPPRGIHEVETGKLFTDEFKSDESKSDENDMVLSRLLESDLHATASSLLLNTTALDKDMYRIAKHNSSRHQNIGDSVLRQSFSSHRSKENALFDMFNSERNTWSLVGILHSTRLNVDVDAFSEDGEPEISPRQAIVDAYEKDPEIRLWDLITQWLHKCASDENNFEKLYMQERISEGPYLPNTTSPRCDPDAPLRDGLKINTDDQDDELQLLESIWQLVRSGAMYHCSFSSIEQEELLFREMERLCYKYGQPWRISSLAGGQPFQFDGNVWKGNSLYSVWRLTCAQLAEKSLKESRESPDPRLARSFLLQGTLYSVLCGDTEWIMDSIMCKSWQDKLWGVVRGMVQAKTDIICIENRKKMLEQFLFVEGSSLEEEAALLEKSRKCVSEYSLEKGFAIVADKVPAPEEIFFYTQRALALGQFNDFCKSQLILHMVGPDWQSLGSRTVTVLSSSPGESLIQQPERDEIFVHTLRFVCHLCIYMYDLKDDEIVSERELQPDPEVLQAIVLAYVHFLVLDNKNTLKRFEFIPVYLKFLHDPAVKSAVLSALFQLIAIAKPESRQDIFAGWQDLLADSEEELLLTTCPREAVRSIRRSKTIPVFLQPAYLNLTASDDFLQDETLRLLRTWECLCLQPATVHESWFQGLLLVRELVSDNLQYSFLADSCTIQVANDFFHDKLCVFLNTAKDHLEHCERLNPVTLSSLNKEHESWDLFFAAQQGIVMWTNGIRQLVSRLENEMSFPDRTKLASDVFSTAMRVCKDIRRVLETDGGWLVDDEIRNVSRARCDSATTQEMDARLRDIGESIVRPGALRKAIIPSMVHMYLSILEKAIDVLQRLGIGSVEELVDLAVGVMETVASDKWGVHFCFQEGEESEELVDRIRLLYVRKLEF